MGTELESELVDGRRGHAVKAPAREVPTVVVAPSPFLGVELGRSFATLVRLAWSGSARWLVAIDRPQQQTHAWRASTVPGQR